jgi:hypothetical protein
VAAAATRRDTDAVVGDPVSWFLIHSGWRVVSADGHEVGRVDEVTGDDAHDIFDGLAVATSALGRPRYVPAEQVASIEEGVVRLSLTREQVGGLGEFLEPPTSAAIEAGDRGGLGATVRGLKSRWIDRPQTHPRPMSVWRRLGFLLRRRVRR